MRDTTRATLEYYLDELDAKGDVLEIGGFRLAQSAIEVFPEPRFRYHDCDLTVQDIPNTIVADITDCRDEIPDESFDVVLSCDVFEHIDRPWLAAAEINRILRPGGIVLTRTVWSWRNHPCPIDYWRFSPECLDFLFQPLECLEIGYDLSDRRVNYYGHFADGADSVPIDAFGGFRENWAVYSVHRKGSGTPVRPFKETTHPLARHLRQDTQGTVTNPRILGKVEPPDLLQTGAGVLELQRRIDQLTAQLKQVKAGQAANVPLSLRAYRRLKRRLHRSADRQRS